MMINNNNNNTNTNRLIIIGLMTRLLVVDSMRYDVKVRSCSIYCRINTHTRTQWQPEIEIWSPKPEVLIFAKVWLIFFETPTANMGLRPDQNRQSALRPFNQRPATGNRRQNRKYLCCWNYNRLHQLSHPSLRGKIKYRPLWLEVRRGLFACVGWQVTLCDPVWRAISRSSEMECH